MSRRKQKNRTLTAEIVDLSHDGRGVAKVDGKTVFVHGALPGEEVTFTIYRRKRSFDEAITDEVHRASSERVEPACSAFGVCGGCALQHLGIEKQRQFKREHLSQNFQDLANLEPADWLPDLWAHPWHYRRRARLGVKNVPGKGRVLVGFRERRSPFIADMHQCEVLTDPVGKLIDPLSELIGNMSIPNKLPQIEVAVGDKVTALVFRILSPVTDADRELLSAFGSSHNVEIYLQPGGLDSITPLGEAQQLSYSLPKFEVNIAFEPLDFVQVNGPLNRRMVEHVIGNCNLRPGDSVLDLFCGLGNFSLPLARCADQVTGVEGDKGLVDRARLNATRNDIDNVEYHVANLFEPEVQWPWLQRNYDVVLVDPPRAGAQEILPHVARRKPRTIAYVSCHPATLARDAAILTTEFGYKLSKAGIMDMFPHTGHVESVAIFDL